MSIVNYLLSISLVVISVVKTAEIFLKSDKYLQKVQKEFVTRTIKSNRGNISLVGATLVLIVSALLIFLITKMQIEYKEALYRKDSYLCSHYLNSKTINYIKKIAQFNNLLRVAFLATTVSPDKISAQSTFGTLKLLRDGEHYLYLKNITFSPYCSSKERLAYWNHLPFKVSASMALETLIDQTTIAKEKKWTITTMKPPMGIRFKKAFCLQSKFTIQGVFFPNTKLESQEFGFEDSVKLKCLSG
jgi:hypothetical protein